MVQIDLISDAHVEMNDLVQGPDKFPVAYYRWAEEAKSDILIVAGDTANDHVLTQRVLTEAAGFYKYVLFVPGNHDYYSCRKHDLTVGQINDQFRQFASSTPNVKFLEGARPFIIGETAFIGCMGWYNWQAYPYASRDQQHQWWKEQINDARLIRFDPEGYPDKLALQEAEQLSDLVRQYQFDSAIREIVVITHVPPTAKVLVPDNHEWAPLNGSYCNTFMNSVWVSDTHKKIKVWCFGHTHILRDETYDGIRFISNPRGYRREARFGPSFKAIKQIDTQEQLGSAFITAP